MKLVAKTGGPAFQSAKAAGNASEWLVAEGDLPHLYVLVMPKKSFVAVF
jgi:hypothetical protein